VLNAEKIIRDTYPTYAVAKRKPEEFSLRRFEPWGLRGGMPYNGLYREAQPERGNFFRLQVYERVGISLVEVY